MCDAAQFVPAALSCAIGGTFLYLQHRGYQKQLSTKLDDQRDAASSLSIVTAPASGRVVPLSIAAPSSPYLRGHRRLPQEDVLLIDLLDAVHSETGPPKRVIAKVVQTARSIIDCERLSLMIISEDRRRLVLRESQDAEGLSVPVDKGVAGFVYATGEVVNVGDVSDDPRFDASIDRVIGFRTRSILCVPVISAGETIGVLQAINARNGPETPMAPSAPASDASAAKAAPHFSSKDEARLIHLATATGITLTKAQVAERSFRERRTTAALFRVVQARAEEGSVRELLNVIIEAAYELLMAERVTLFLVDATKGELWAAVSRERDFEGTRIPFGQGIAGNVARTGRLVNVRNAYGDDRFDRSFDKSTGFRTRTVLCTAVPGFASSGDTSSDTESDAGASSSDRIRQPIAVIQAINKLNDETFDEHDEAALRAFSAEVSMALKRRTVEAHLLKLLDDAGRDPALRSTAQLQSSFLQQFSADGGGAKVTAEVSISHISLSMDRARRPSVQWPVLSRGYGGDGMPAAGVGEHVRWDLDVHTTTEDKLLGLTFDIFEEFNLLQRFVISQESLRAWIISVHGLYHREPAFHNFRHAFSVFHVSHLLLARAASAHLRSVDVLACLVAALCHDVEHPGHSNSLEISRRSPLARLYCDDAPLERHHAAAACRLLDEKETNLLGKLKPPEARWCRKMIVSGILSTDMTHHRDIVAKLDQRCERCIKMPPSAPDGVGSSSSSSGLPMPFSRDCEEDRLELVSAVVHSSDLSGQAMPAHIARKWGAKVIDEFRAQASLEARLELPVTEFMTGLENKSRQAQLQIGFVSHVVLPLWRAMATLYPSLTEAVKHCEQSLRLYQEDAAKIRADEDGGQ